MCIPVSDNLTSDCLFGIHNQFSLHQMDMTNVYHNQDCTEWSAWKF